jgi:copper chaperone CopZ
MKFILPLFLAIFMMAAGCKNSTGDSTGKVIAQDTATLNLSKVEFKVSGMHCTGCENAIKNNVKELNGVKTVDASYRENTAIVSYDSTKTNESVIAGAIKDAGYKVDTFLRK